jgi:hypothetical protein
MATRLGIRTVSIQHAMAHEQALQMSSLRSSPSVNVAIHCSRVRDTVRATLSNRIDHFVFDLLYGIN